LSDIDDDVDLTIKHIQLGAIYDRLCEAVHTVYCKQSNDPEIQKKFPSLPQIEDRK
jgi:hypothetical protein